MLVIDRETVYAIADYGKLVAALDRHVPHRRRCAGALDALAADAFGC